MRVRTQPFYLCLFCLSFFLPTTTAARAAQHPVSGTYRCVSIQSGSQTTPCNGMALILYRNGTYRLWTELGTYRIRGRYLVLSESKKRGPGHFHGRREISFDYVEKAVRYTVIFRRDDLPSGTVRS